MKTSFVAFLNKRGIACASDTDMTLYALSRQEPVALAVNSYSPIPWDSIINAYLRKGDIPLHESFIDYAHDFVNFLPTVDANPKWKTLTDEDRNIIFLGFGSDDVFPAGVDMMVSYDEDTQKLISDYEQLHTIDVNCYSAYFYLSKFDNVQSILFGMSESRRQEIKDMYTDIFHAYQDRIKAAVKNTEYEDDISKYISENNAAETYAEEIDRLCSSQQKDVFMALDSFNVEDLVMVAENYVDSQDQLEHLKTCGKYPLKQTKELAVITRTEGLTWIKHSLYGN